MQEDADLLKTETKKAYLAPVLTIFGMDATAGNANLSTDQLQTGS